MQSRNHAITQCLFLNLLNNNKRHLIQYMNILSLHARTAKQLYFRFMASLQISNPKTLASLVMNCYNGKTHSAIGMSPIQCHFDSFSAGTVAEMNKMKQQRREIEAIDIEMKKNKRQMLRLNQQVKIRKKNNVFRKESLFTPAFSDKVHVITKIDTTTYPILYSVSNSRHRFYSHQLMPLSDSFPNDELMPKPRHRILVQDIIKSPNYSFNRSGKVRAPLGDEDDIKYITLRDGKIAHLTQADLRLYRSLFGNDIIAYHSVFNQPEYRKHVV